jgi:very-short-patch-repair endonuclease
VGLFRLTLSKEVTSLLRGVKHREMRYNLSKKHSSKPERIVYEILKELRLPFRHRWIVGGREIDFLVLDKYAIEIDGHEQDEEKNNGLMRLGYVPIHIHNHEIANNIGEIKKLLCQLQNQN